MMLIYCTCVQISSNLLTDCICLYTYLCFEALNILKPHGIERLISSKGIFAKKSYSVIIAALVIKKPSRYNAKLVDGGRNESMT